MLTIYPAFCQIWPNLMTPILISQKWPYKPKNWQNCKNLWNLPELIEKTCSWHISPHLPPFFSQLNLFCLQCTSFKQKLGHHNMLLSYIIYFLVSSSWFNCRRIYCTITPRIKICIPTSDRGAKGDGPPLLSPLRNYLVAQFVEGRKILEMTGRFTL